jgi:hypothetical protein
MSQPKNPKPPKGAPKPGQFQPGNRFGRGRPQGSRNSATIALQALLDGEGEEITRTAVTMALNGNETALRLCLERLLPAKKDRTINFALPSIEDAAGVSAAMGSVLSAVAAGDITPAEAASLAALLETRRKALETRELAERIEALELHAAEHPQGDGTPPLIIEVPVVETTPSGEEVI